MSRLVRRVSFSGLTLKGTHEFDLFGHCPMPPVCCLNARVLTEPQGVASRSWGGSQQPRGSLFTTIKQVPRGALGKQSLFIVGKSVGRQELKPRALLSQSQIPGVICGHCVLRSAGPTRWCFSTTQLGMISARTSSRQ